MNLQVAVISDFLYLSKHFLNILKSC